MPVYLLPAAERHASAFEYFEHGGLRLGLIYSAAVERLPAIVRAPHREQQLRVPEHRDVCVVRDEHHLPPFLNRTQDLHDGREDEGIVEIVLRLVNDERDIGLREHRNREHDRVLLAVGKLVYGDGLNRRALGLYRNDRARGLPHRFESVQLVVKEKFFT